KQPKPKTQICRFCRQAKLASQLKPRHIKNLPNQDPRQITLICQECLTYRAIKADYYCPRTSKGRDTYEGNEFDCYCPTNERRNESDNNNINEQLKLQMSKLVDNRTTEYTQDDRTTYSDTNKPLTGD